MAENEIALPVLQGEMKSDVERLEAWTKTVVVANPQERVTVYEAVKKVKAMKTGIVNFFKDSKDRAYGTWKAIVANEKSMTDKLDAFESAAKLAIQKYDLIEEAWRVAEENRLQAIENEKKRIEREKAEAEVRRQRQIEEDARRVAEAARLKAEKANAEKRAQLLKEAEAAECKAAAANAKAEIKTEQAEAAVPSAIHLESSAQKQEGESSYKKWHCRIVDPNLIPREWMIPNEKALEKVAESTKGIIKIPGCEMWFENIMAIRK